MNKRNYRTIATILALCVACFILLSACQTINEAFPVTKIASKNARYFSAGAKSLDNSQAARLYLPNTYYRGVDGEKTIGIINSVIKLSPGSHEVRIAEQKAAARTLRYIFEQGELYLFARVSMSGYALYRAEESQWIEIETYAPGPYEAEFDS